MFTTYIIYSQKLDRFYVGHCSHIEERLSRHRNGRGFIYTKKAQDWALCWFKSSSSRAEAVKLERFIKKKKSRKYIEKLISGHSGN